MLALGMLAGLLTGCQTDAGRVAVSFYDGTVSHTEKAVHGPLHVELWQARYYPGATSRNAAGTQVIAPGATQVFMKVQNTGTSTALLFSEAFDAQGQPPPPPAAYLEDQLARRYPATGSGWSRPVDEPPGNEGKALPGKTADIHLSFDAIPRDVTALTLVWDVRFEDGMTYPVTLPVPLPATE